MKRRLFLATSSLLALSSAPVHAQVTDLPDAINKAGRQRMLSQRMAKAWLALLQKTESGTAQQVLDRSMALFDRQHAELKAYAPTPELQATYQKMEGAWSDYKGLLVGAAPQRTNAANLLAADAKVLALAHQGTVQYEAASGKPVGRLVNIAGRQRMLSQRMAKFYLAAAVPVEREAAQAELAKARAEFLGAMDTLRQAPEATPRIREELQLADGQWVFFDNALQKSQASSPRFLSDVFVTSENLLAVMDRVTGLYAAIKA